jgi:hypothetical protein
MSRELSKAYLTDPGVKPTTWDLDEIPIVGQVGQYANISVGAVYHKQPGKTLKSQLLDRFACFKDLHLFNSLWGLQISLCTGVARRVPLRALIQEPLLSFIDRLRVEAWEALKPQARLAFQGEIDFDNWIDTLSNAEASCIHFVFEKMLELLKDTGIDRNDKNLSVLWPHSADPYSCVKLCYDEHRLWFKMLKDSEWSATFAVATSLCLETSDHVCRRTVEAPWIGGGLLFSTAVCPNLSGTVPPAVPVKEWQLRDSENYWIGKCGAEVWISVHKMPNSQTELHVKRNRIPTKFWSRLRDFQILRERQDEKFWAEAVHVSCT